MKNNLLIDNPNLDNPEMRPMSFSDMTTLIENGHTIGSHTMDHRRLSEIKSQDALYSEIVTSKLVLEKNIKINVEHFAFPFGDINSISNNAMKLAIQNYRYVYSGLRGLNTLQVKKHALRREPLHLVNNVYYNMFVINYGVAF